MIYLLIDFLVLIYGALFKRISVVVRSVKTRKYEVFFLFSAITLIFFSAFRGDFTSDYSNYILLYDTFKDSTLIEILSRSMSLYPEKGYLVFQFVITNLFHNSLFIFVFTSIIVVLAHLSYIKNYIDEYVLAILMFVCVGGYFSSFNLVRQLMAVSILICGSKYLYERRFWKYMIFVLIAATIHKSSLIMIPFFFFSRIKVGRKGILVYPAILAGIAFLTPFIISIIQRFYWGWYFTSGVTGYSWKNVIGPLMVALPPMIITLLERRKLMNYCNDKEYMIENIGLNATFLYASFNILGLQVAMAQRFASFFSLYAIGLFCNKINVIKEKRIVTVVCVFLVIIYQFVTRLDVPYYFVWNNG